jgi:energy-coupling factor transport system permease protein
MAATFNVLRALPGTSPMHRLWAGTKLVGATALGVAVVARPTWPALGIAVALLLVGAAAARFPPSALPRVPRWVLWLLLIGALVDFTAGGDPEVTIGDRTIGLGGIEVWLRFTTLGVVIFAIAILLAATTPISELPGAVDRLSRPARWLRLPIDELVAAFTLVVRSFPLLVDEMRTLYAAWRLRRPSLPRDIRIVAELHDVLVTAIAASLRRSRDLARAMEARGGLARVASPPAHLGANDALAFALVVLAVAGIALV